MFAVLATAAKKIAAKRRIFAPMKLFPLSLFLAGKLRI